ncbi:MAG TPA: peptidylprolyl isomerase [Devosia sp.]
MISLRQPAARLARMFVSALALSAALGLAPALAQDAAAPAAPAAVTPQTVVATVGGEPITEADISFAAEDLQQELQQMPANERKAFLLTVLIDMKVMAKAARDANMDQTDLFKQRLRYLEDRALRRAYFGEKIATAVTPEALQAAYDKFVAEFQGQEEVHARHILVATEDEAKAVKAELDGGKDFATLAKEKSTDPSAQQNGGDLGFFGKGMMVKPFEEAAFSLQPGIVSDPVKSDFGWHVIKVEEKRMSKPPSLDQIAPQLQQQVMFQNFENSVAALKQGVAIDIPDPTLAEGVKQQTEANTAGQ